MKWNCNRIVRRWFLFVALMMSACTGIAPFPATEEPVPTATLLPCSEFGEIPDRSILTPFTPSEPCALWNASNHVDFCMVQESAEVSYPCFQTEEVQENVLSKSKERVLIQRDYQLSRGCSHAVPTDVRSLRRCDAASGESRVLAENILGEIVPSQDEEWFAFVVPEPGSNRLKPHIYRVRADGSDLLQLDTQPYPLERVVGAQILGWSRDGEWLEISLWDGSDEGFYEYRLRTDGSGEFEPLP